MSACPALLVLTRFQAAYTYFHQKFQNDLKLPLSIFHHYFNPSKVCSLNPTAADSDLKVIPSLSSNSVQHGLKQELLKYVAATEGVSNKLNWWKSTRVIYQISEVLVRLLYS